MLKSNTEDEEEILSSLNAYRLVLPQMSTEEMEQKISEQNASIAAIDEKIASYGSEKRIVKIELWHKKKE